MALLRELPGFPFENISEFREAVLSKKAFVGADYTLSRNWAIGGLHTNALTKHSTQLLLLTPIIGILMILGWWILTKQWLVMLSIPLLLIFAFIAMPPNKNIFGGFRTLLYYFSIATFLYGCMAGNSFLIILSGYVLVTWLSLYLAYSFSLLKFQSAVIFHEDLLSAAWNTGHMNITMFNGMVYYKDN